MGIKLRLPTVFVAAGRRSKMLFAIVFQSLVQEIEKSEHVFFVTVRTRQRPAFVVERHVKGLGVSAEFAALQIAPLVADGTQGTFLPVVGYFYRLFQRRFVIYEQRNEHIVFGQNVGNRGV